MSAASCPCTGRATCPACGREIGTQTASGTATTVLREHRDHSSPYAPIRCNGSRTVVEEVEQR